MITKHYWIWLLAAGLTGIWFFTGCGHKKRPERIAMKQNPVVESYDKKTEEKSLNLNGIRLTLPDGWVKQPPSSEMRLAEIHIRDMAEPLTVFYFGNRENMIAPNIQRWKNQFSSIENFHQETLKNGAVMVKINGVYKKKPFPMAQSYEDTPGYMMLAAILMTEQGPYYFKLTGKEKQMDRLKPEFLDFLKSYE